MYEFVITSDKERKLIDSVACQYSLTKSKDLVITEKSGVPRGEHIPNGMFSFFLPSYKYKVKYYQTVFNTKTDEMYRELIPNSLSSNICICSFQESSQHLNAIRSNNPKLAFQFLYFLASQYPQDLSDFLFKIETKHKVQSLGMINYVNIKNFNLEKTNKFLSFLEVKKQSSLILISSKDVDIKEKLRGDFVIHNYHESDETFLNLIYYRRVNWKIYKELLEVSEEFDYQMRYTREQEREEEIYEESRNIEEFEQEDYLENTEFNSEERDEFIDLGGDDDFVDFEKELEKLDLDSRDSDVCYF